MAEAEALVAELNEQRAAGLVRRPCRQRRQSQPAFMPARLPTLPARLPPQLRLGADGPGAASSALGDFPELGGAGGGGEGGGDAEPMDYELSASAQGAAAGARLLLAGAGGLGVPEPGLAREMLGSCGSWQRQSSCRSRLRGL
jgi:hypothetical protein